MAREDLGGGWFCPSLPVLMTFGINLGWAGHRQKAELCTLWTPAMRRMTVKQTQVQPYPICISEWLPSKMCDCLQPSLQPGGKRQCHRAGGEGDSSEAHLTAARSVHLKQTQQDKPVVVLPQQTIPSGSNLLLWGFPSTQQLSAH